MATGLFVVTLGTVIETAVVLPAPTDPVAAAEADATAATLADLILGLPGIGWYAALHCIGDEPDPLQFDPERIARFGLGVEPCPGRAPNEALILSGAKVADVLLADADANPTNRHVDYAEARRSLGLDASGADFHLRLTPIGPNATTPAVDRRIAYVGDYHPYPLPGKKPTTLRWTPSPAALAEAAYLARLSPAFAARAAGPEFDDPKLPHRADGDVYADIPFQLDARIRQVLRDGHDTRGVHDDSPRLETYDALVIGSNVGLISLFRGQALQALRDWVHAGGLLVVLGTFTLSPFYLLPLLRAATNPANVPLVRDDPAHPLLNHPNVLRPGRYRGPQGEPWPTQGGSLGAAFTHVLVRDWWDLLAVSQPGAFGQGRVVLTAYQPFRLAGYPAPAPCQPPTLRDSCEALPFLENLLGAERTTPTLDYGPALPDDRPIGVVRHLVAVDPPGPGPTLEYVAEVYEWRG